MGDNICSNTAYQNSLLIKKRFQLNNIPPQRYNNLTNTPYNNYTQYQIDMRRKAEILKYTASKSGTKTNDLTKRQLWAQLVSGSNQRRSLSSSFIQENAFSQTDTSIFVQTCPSGTIIQTPSYASDVPGSIVSLFLDPTIPLYNYATGQDAYAFTNVEINSEPFSYTYSTNQKLYYINDIPQNSILLASVNIRNIKTMTYSFTIKLPLSMYIRAEVNPNINNNITPFNQRINVRMYVENNKVFPFSCNVIFLNTNLTILYDLDISKLVNYTEFDISMIPNYTDPNNNSFYGNQYVGTITISNFRVIYPNSNSPQNGLDVQNGYIYDISLNILDNLNFNYLNTAFDSSSFNTYFNNLETGYYINVTPDRMNQFINCAIRNAAVYSNLGYSSPSVT